MWHRPISMASNLRCTNMAAYFGDNYVLVFIYLEYSRPKGQNSVRTLLRKHRIFDTREWNLSMRT